jgi:uncharacterized membrane protein
MRLPAGASARKRQSTVRQSNAMTFPPDAIPAPWQWLFHAFFAVVLVLSLRRAPWDYLRNREDSNILFASAVILWVVWQLRTDIPATEGLEFHLLMATTVTLMFGWAFAFLVVCAAQVLVTLQGMAQWGSFAAIAVCSGAIPIGVTILAYSLSRRWLPRHFFVYIFVCCFGAGALSMLASRLAGMAVVLSGETHSLYELQADGYFVMIPVTMFPEAFVNGAIMTMLVVFRPHWVGSFRDQHYLKGR